MNRIPQWLVGYLVAVVLVIAATVLVALGHDVPTWFSDLAIFSAGGSTGIAVANHVNQP